jgi:hypothetical protein
MTNHYGALQKRKGQEDMRKSDVLAVMRRRAILQATFSRPGIAWTLNGAVVPHNTAAAVITLPEIRIRSDRAAAIAVRQILADADALDPDELQLRLEGYLRDELADIEQQIASDREIHDA